MLFPWIKRPDLIAVPHDSGGWVVKDPLTMHYAYLDDTEYTILNFLDGRVSLNRLLQRVQEQCPKESLTENDLGLFIRSLAGHQLVRQISPGDSLRLTKQSHRPVWQRFVQPLFRILRVQVPLVNPSRWISATLPIASLIVSPIAIRVLLLVVVAALALVVLRFHELTAALPSLQEFLGPQNVALMLVIFVIVKILHEAGHAFTAKHFGAECNECGVMLMVFTPVLYTNVTDSWMLPRRQRMLVTAAGIAVELVIASACTILWWQASQGLLKSLLLNTMLMCSVNTILFNGNPLLRFDGYFLLADFLGIPNLAGRSSTLVQNRLLQIVTGRAEESFETGRDQVILLLYGVFSMAYRVFLTLAILQLVRQVTAQWNIQLVGSLLTISVLSGFLVFPVLRFFGQLFDTDVMAEYDAKVWTRIAVATLFGCGVLFFPVSQSVVAPAFVQSTALPVYSTLDGLMLPEAQYGDAVSSGTPLATLQNSELTATGQRLSGRVAELKIQLESLVRNPVTANSELIPTVRESLNAATEQWKQFQEESEGLVIVSDQDGLFLPPPAVPHAQSTDLTEFWSGTAVTLENTGAWISRGTLLGYVGEPTDIEVLAYVSEDDVEFVRSGQSAKFLSASGGATVTTGIVKEVSTLESKTLPNNLVVSGMINGRPVEGGIEPLAVTYVVTVVLANHTDVTPPPLYSVGHVRVATHSTSLFRRIQRYLRQTF